MNKNLLDGKTFLVVDDEMDLRDIVASELEFMGAKVFQAENISRAGRILDENKIDLVVSDIRMPGGTGLDLLNQMKSQNVQSPPIILITGFADITLEDAFNQGAEALLNKPFKLDDLIKLAVKFTQTTKDRFAEDQQIPQRTLNLNLAQTIDSKVEAGELLIGRGGISIKFPFQSMKYELGDVIHFKFVFEDKALDGVGICRWFKATEQGSGLASIGLEFVSLSDESLNFLIQFWKHTLPVSYIPSFEAK